MQGFNYQLFVQTMGQPTCITIYYGPNQASLEYLAAQPTEQMPAAATPITRAKTSCSKQRSRTNQMWSAQQDLEYFYFSIVYSIENPYFTVSWQFWKPARFYISMEAHMAQIFGQDCSKSSKQCKTKDQNLKNRYYLKGAPRMDLLELSLQKLEEWMVGRQMEGDRGREMCAGTLNRYNRFEEIMTKFGKFEQTMSRPKKYQEEFGNLLEYSASVRVEMLHLGKLLNDTIDRQRGA